MATRDTWRRIEPVRPHNGPELGVDGDLAEVGRIAQRGPQALIQKNARAVDLRPAEPPTTVLGTSGLDVLADRSGTFSANPNRPIFS